MRVGVIALLQESNTFAPIRTSLADFEHDMLLTGEAAREKMLATHHEVGGMLSTLAENGEIESVPILVARAIPGGTMYPDCFDHLLGLIKQGVAEAGEFDGILVAPHGATVAENHPDADGYWLTELRALVGNDIPIIGTLDAHANLSEAMVAATNALVVYRTNPHIDQRARGQEAANLMIRTLRGEILPTQAAVMPPMAINIEKQCTDEEPACFLAQQAEHLRQQPGVLSVSVLLGFPYADVAEMGSAVICVTDHNFELAEQYAEQLADYLWEHRYDFVGEFISAQEAVDQAAQLSEPVCLLDMGDNVGGGSPADGTIIAHVIQDRKFGPAFVCLFDPQAVQQAVEAGVGSEVELSMGGKTDERHGAPLTTKVKVVSIHDGQFEEKQARHGGFTQFNMEETAIVETAYGLTIQLTSKRVAPFSLEQIRSCALDPARFRILVAKGVNAPLAAYGEVCPHKIRVNTPGVTSADMRQLTYHNRRRPMFPFEEEADFHGDSQS